MGKLISGWKKAVFWDPDSGDAVQVNTLSTEHSSFEPAIIKNETPTGSAFGGRRIPLVVGFLDSDGIPQLETWMEGNTPVRSAVYARAGKQIIFQESEEIAVVPGYGISMRNGADVHRAEMEVLGENPDVVQKQNVAEAIEFTANVGDIILPISGITWTVAADYTTADGNLVVTAYDYSDGVVATSSQALSAGRVSTGITAPAGTWRIEIDLVDTGASVPSNVSMRADGNAEYVNY
ncbi:MAG: hypothetical protein WED82_01900 [Balneolales bacterium]